MVNTKELQKEQKLFKPFPQNIDNTTTYIYTLVSILRGEHLNKN